MAICSSCKPISHTTITEHKNDTIIIKDKRFHELGIANMTLQQIEEYWGKGVFSTSFQMTKELCLGEEKPEIDCEVLNDSSQTVEEYLWYLDEYMLRQVFFLEKNGRLIAIDGRETCINCIHLP